VGGALGALGLKELWDRYFKYKTSKAQINADLQINSNDEIRKLKDRIVELESHIYSLEASRENMYMVMDMLVSAIEADYAESPNMKPVIEKVKEWLKDARKNSNHGSPSPGEQRN